MTIEYFITSLVVILLPGTGVIYTIAVGISRGFVPGVAAALGCTFGIVPAATASILGLAAIFHTSAMAFLMVKYLGVAYLLYMAWSILKDDGFVEINASNNKKSYSRIAVDGALLNVLNPKLSLFFLAFLPQFVPQAYSGSLGYLTLLAAGFMIMTFLVFILYGACASVARKHVLESPSLMIWLKRAFAGAFGFLGLKLAFSDG